VALNITNLYFLLSILIKSLLTLLLYRHYVAVLINHHSILTVGYLDLSKLCPPGVDVSKYKLVLLLNILVLTSKYPRLSLSFELVQSRITHYGYSMYNIMHEIATFLTNVNEIRSEHKNPQYRLRTSSLKTKK
jgi:hypothetical protein